jgi:iron complex transport system permease protein
MSLATPRLWIPASAVFLAAALLIGALVGPVHLGVIDVVHATFAHIFGLHSPLSGPDDAILWQLRLPRVVLGALVGGTLAAAGAAYQGVFRNPLADPYLLGAAAGAGLGATMVAAYAPASGLTGDLLPISAFVGAALAVVAAYALGRSAASWLILLGHRRLLDVLAVGDDEAAALGVDVARVRLFVVAAATIATAAAVAVSGLIAFVGIIVPHTIRLLAGGSYRLLLPLSIIVGAGFLVFADVIARTIVSPAELPIGVVTAFFGAPFFAVVLRTGRRYA